MVAWNDIFIARFAELVRPLRDLANSKGKYVWLPEHDKIFSEVKEKFSENCLNNYFQLDRETFLFTAAGKKSNDPANKHGGFSAILAQKDEHGNFLPIHFASRSIAPLETGYSQLELEGRALRFGVDKFRYYIEGIEKVTCFVDAKALLPFFDHENVVIGSDGWFQHLFVGDFFFIL